MLINKLSGIPLFSGNIKLKILFLVLHSGVWKRKVICRNDDLMRIIHSFTLIVFVTYGGYAFAYDPLDCLNDIASVDSEIPIGLATRLCSGTWTPEPVKCIQNR